MFFLVCFHLVSRCIPMYARQAIGLGCIVVHTKIEISCKKRQISYFYFVCGDFPLPRPRGTRSIRIWRSFVLESKATVHPKNIHVSSMNTFSLSLCVSSIFFGCVCVTLLSASSNSSIITNININVCLNTNSLIRVDRLTHYNSSKRSIDRAQSTNQREHTALFCSHIHARWAQCWENSSRLLAVFA